MYHIYFGEREAYLECLGEQPYINTKGSQAVGFHYEIQYALPTGLILKVLFVASHITGSFVPTTIRSVKTIGSGEATFNSVLNSPEMAQVLVDKSLEWAKAHQHMLGLFSSIPQAEVRTKCGVVLRRVEFQSHVQECKLCRGVVQAKDWIDPATRELATDHKEGKYKERYDYVDKCTECEAARITPSGEVRIH